MCTSVSLICFFKPLLFYSSTFHHCKLWNCYNQMQSMQNIIFIRQNVNLSFQLLRKRKVTIIYIYIFFYLCISGLKSCILEATCTQSCGFWLLNNLETVFENHELQRKFCENIFRCCIFSWRMHLGFFRLVKSSPSIVIAFYLALLQEKLVSIDKLSLREKSQNP